MRLDQLNEIMQIDQNHYSKTQREQLHSSWYHRMEKVANVKVKFVFVLILIIIQKMIRTSHAKKQV